MRRLGIAALVPVLLLIGPLDAAPHRPPRPTPAAAAAPGYHHLGATSVDRYTGVLGRLAVTDPTVRPGTYDFVAARFMARVDHGGETHWLEAGWAETGWAGGGAQRIYTFDTIRDTWMFHDGYAVRPGDRVWIYVEAGPEARAWVWWDAAWHLLTTVALPMTDGGQVEQYVEVHIDPARGGSVAVPRVAVDNVQVRHGGALRYWRAGDVATVAGDDPGGGYCLDWELPHDTWSAGDCAP